MIASPYTYPSSATAPLSVQSDEDETHNSTPFGGHRCKEATRRPVLSAPGPPHTTTASIHRADPKQP